MTVAIVSNKLLATCRKSGYHRHLVNRPRAQATFVQRRNHLLDQNELAELLKSTVEDRRLSRSEKKDIQAALHEFGTDPQRIGLIRSFLFKIAREALSEPEQQPVLDWLEDAVKAITISGTHNVTNSDARAFFTPEDNCPSVISQLIGRARKTLDICVFTITDNRVSESIKDAKANGISVRILTDNDKSNDLGSDIAALKEAGIPVRMDTTPHHMHHKFAIFDRKLLLNGSYNWTRSASEKNQENIVLNDDPDLIRAFQQRFDAMWEMFG